jgi:hypothetical protein
MEDKVIESRRNIPRYSDLDTVRLARWKQLDATARFVGLGIELGLKMSKTQGREMVRQVFYLADKELSESESQVGLT